MFLIKEMLYLIENRDDLENLNELVSLQKQIGELRLQDKKGKQNLHEHMKKVFEPITISIKDTSEILTRSMMITSKEITKHYRI